jgi:DNA anti-recombination protein RmuC
MMLSPDQRKFYEHTLEMTRKEISEVEGQIQEELAKVKDRLADLQNAQKAARQMYDAACMRLGIPNDLEESESRG